jgi:iron(III) transport system ATP-binding protein
VNALTVRGVRKSFGAAAVLKGVDLAVPAGSVTAVLGPSGCGKTTLLRLIAGFERPDDGSIEVGGRPVSGPAAQVPTERRGLGYLAQEGALFPHLTVARNITFGLPRARRRDTGRVRELLDLVSLDQDLANRYPHQLSGGQQQRVALARTLAPQPRLVLLDEPFSALDTGLRAETRAAVASALSAAAVTTLLVTHDQAEALSFADRVAVMDGGVFAQVGSPAEIYQWPADLRTAKFIGATCLVPAECNPTDAGFATSPLGRVPIRRRSGEPLPSAGRGWLMLRPEQLAVVPDRADENPTGVPARITAVEYFGHDCVVTAALLSRSAEPVRVTCRITGTIPIRQGTTVRITVSGAGLMFAEPHGARSRLDADLDVDNCGAPAMY